MSSWRVVALSVAMAAAGVGSARAADEWSSFTDRAKESQHVGWAAANGEQAIAATGPAGAEAESFIARVEASQGVRVGAFEGRAPGSAPAFNAEAASFTARAQASQGLPSAELEEEGAASVEPDAH
jgi:hypothetical protein